jgi:hypothetical protein
MPIARTVSLARATAAFTAHRKTAADSPIDCAFGGEDLALLFVTTASGELFCVRSSGMRGQNQSAGAHDR